MRALLFLLALGGIDDRISERWKDEKIRPAAVADDFEFLRRLSLDLRGVIPTVDEIEGFIRSRDREKIIDTWLRSREFARHWGDLWSAELLGPDLRNDGLVEWLQQAIQLNMPLDRFATRLVTSKGPMNLDPASAFLLRRMFENEENGPIDAAVTVSRVFLGRQIRCAECHDHPFDDLTQVDFRKQVAHFQATEARFDFSEGEDRVKGWLVDEGNRRRTFARSLVEDRQFARAGANRIWGMVMGRGLVHPLDGFTARRRPSHPELLDELATGFADSKFDVRKLIRSILMSKPYQLSSKRADAVDDKWFARGLIRPLRPGVLFDSIVRATGFRGEELGEMREEFSRQWNPGDEIAEASISQALQFLNGEMTRHLTRAEDDLRLGRLLRRESKADRRIEHLYLATLSRPPVPAELARMKAYIRKQGGEWEAYEDILWALLNSTEFVTRH